MQLEPPLAVLARTCRRARRKVKLSRELHGKFLVEHGSERGGGYDSPHSDAAVFVHEGWVEPLTSKARRVLAADRCDGRVVESSIERSGQGQSVSINRFPNRVICGVG